MTYFNWQKIKHASVRYLMVHLFLSLISLPILIVWGLPLSLLSPIGNFVFTPFLMIFLLLSSIIFFTELVWIPNGHFTQLLDSFTKLWIAILEYCSCDANISFIRPTSIWLLISLPLLACIILSRQSGTLIRKLALLLSLLIGCYLVLQPSSGTQQVYEIVCGKKPVYVIQAGNKIYVVDQGALARASSARSWVQYTLMQEVRKKTGHTHIDYFIASKPSIFLFEALTALCEQQEVGTIMLPWWNGNVSASAWRNYKQLLHQAAAHKITIKKTSKEQRLQCTDDTFLKITPCQKSFTYHTAQYHPLMVSGTIDNGTHDFYDAQGYQQ